MTRYSLFAALALVAALAIPAGALAAPSAQGQAHRAEQALKHAQALADGSAGGSGGDLTTALGDLFRLRGDLGTADRKQANALLARPTDSESSPGHAYSNGAAQAVDCGTHFCVHYVTNTSDAPPLTDTTPANGIPDYVDSMLAVFDSEVYPCENTTGLTACAGTKGAGWPGPKSDGSIGGGPTSGMTDVYIEDLPTNLFGYAAPDPTQSGSGGTAYAYLVMDDDYAEFGYPDVMVPVRVTAAHEYNHVLQFGIDLFEDTWMYESTATYFEDLVYPSLNDYLNYMNTWVNFTADPLTDANGGNGLKMYGSAVWNHFVAGRHTRDAILDAWQAKVQENGGSFAPASYSAAIAANGGTSFTDEFEDFSAAVAEWEAPNQGFPDTYPDVPDRPDQQIDAPSTSVSLNHTTFAFLNVPVPADPGPITLSASLPNGLKGAIALVGRTGNDPTAGTVTHVITRLPLGGGGKVTLDDADTYGRITAVLINADTSHGDWDPNISDWTFTKDNQLFTGVRVRTGIPTLSPPTATTLDADEIGLTNATLNGNVIPNGEPTTYYFEYGTTTAYGSKIPLSPVNIGDGTSSVTVGAVLGNLTPGTTYHFRIVGTNADGTGLGEDRIFTTMGAAPGTAPPAATTPSIIPPQTSPTTSNVQPFVLSFTLTGGKLATVLRKGLAAHPRCTLQCFLVAKLVLPSKLAKQLKLKPTLATITGRGGTVLKLRMSSKAAKALRRLRKVSFKVLITATAQDGRKAKLTRSITLRR